MDNITKLILEVIGTCIAICSLLLSVYAIVRSSKKIQNDALDVHFHSVEKDISDLRKELQVHLVDDAVVQTKLKADVDNMEKGLSDKFQQILEAINDQDKE